VMWIVAYRNSNGTPATLTSGSRTTEILIFVCREDCCHIVRTACDLSTQLEGSTSHAHSEM